MQIIQIIQIRNTSALKGLDHQVGTDHTDHLSEVWKIGKNKVDKQNDHNIRGKNGRKCTNHNAEKK